MDKLNTIFLKYNRFRVDDGAMLDMLQWRAPYWS